MQNITLSSVATLAVHRLLDDGRIMEPVPNFKWPDFYFTFSFPWIAQYAGQGFTAINEAASQAIREKLEACYVAVPYEVYAMPVIDATFRYIAVPRLEEPRWNAHNLPPELVEILDKSSPQKMVKAVRGTLAAILNEYDRLNNERPPAN